MKNNIIDIRDEIFDLEILEIKYSDFQNIANSKMLELFIDMDSNFEVVEFERWLLDNGS